MIDILSSMQWLDAQYHVGDSCLAADTGGNVFDKPPSKNVGLM
jgi:hypothetical protein